jgi:hypothetical protein
MSPDFKGDVARSLFLLLQQMGLLCVDALLALVGEYCCDKLCLSPAIFALFSGLVSDNL